MRHLLVNLLVFLLLAGCATGSAIVTGTTRAPVAAESVKLLLEPPAAYETIGLVSAEAYSAATTQMMQDNAVAELKAQAGKLGANAVILRDSADRTSNTATYNKFTGFSMASSTRPTLKGEAIFVK